MTTVTTVSEATAGHDVGIVVPDEIALGFNRGKRVRAGDEVEVRLTVDHVR
jgi:hypothetical protein